MTITLLVIAIAFWVLLVYYTVLTIGGAIFRAKASSKSSLALESYPSVSVLIPAHNEGKVLGNTLRAMVQLVYPGDLTVYVLNDNSQDETGEVADAYAEVFTRIQHVRVPSGSPQGKSRVLNYGLSLAKSDYVAVYDADNQPEPQALKLLVEAAVRTPGAAGAVGYVKTLNEQRNWLTRMISLEFSTFQLLMQSGRWCFFKLGSLTGTNMLVKRSDLLDVGGWDPYALAEDAELTLQLTAKGKLLPIVPESRTWEQEPETVRVWLRQRTRWMQGNLYLIEKTLRTPSWIRGRVLIHTLQTLLVYVCFVFFLLVSDVWFVLGLFGVVHTEYIRTPLLLIWAESWLLYSLQIFSALMTDSNVTIRNVIGVSLMYFSYAQMWIYLLVRASLKHIKHRLSHAEVTWDKTIRF
ncbi:glycosyltransferase family 2 protein [Alicyclobacillus suci]|uniref:glycosyltransferase family 2 protein n=1 Tax=Alicyclobacillus suci TaxID=2816080 RepID=UPI001A900344|nr:glycosyltransferase [Alicyclobacillus suci]